jgi:SPFH domain / Band 7 family
MSSLVATILLIVLVILVVAAITRSVRIVPQARAGIVERFGRYHRTLHAGLNMVTPFVDRLLPLIDLREQVVSFPPQPRSPHGIRSTASCGKSLTRRQVSVGYERDLGRFGGAGPGRVVRAWA